MDKCIYICKSNLEYNLNYYKEECKKDIIAIVKNNAYGHGVREISKIIDKKIKMYAVSNIKEAKKLRRYTEKDILLLDKVDDYKNKDEHMIFTVISLKHLKELIELDIDLRVHIKVNINMKRKGIDKNEIFEAIELIKQSKLKLEGIYTHYSTYKKKEVQKQFIKFKNSLDNLDLSNLMIHAASSISALNFKEDFTNAIRLGVGMYGLKKLDKCMDDLKVTTTLVCYSKNIYPIKCFDRFSYHDLYIGAKGYVVVVNLGYGDGVFYKNVEGYLYGSYIQEIGHRNMDNMYFYSSEYIFNNSEIEIFGENVSLDDFARKNKIPVCKILALFNEHIEKKIV